MAKAFRFGVVSAGGPSSEAWINQAKRIEELGYSSLLVPDRTITPLAALTALTVAAAVSNGRFEMGIGAGVGAADFQQLGIPFDNAGTRVSRFAEALSIIKQYFTEGSVNFAGKYYTITEMRAIPKPVQKPYPPIFIGTTGRRMLTIAAQEADIIAPGSRRDFGDPTDAPLEEKIGWIREAAGERFAHIELARTVFGIELTDSPARVTPAIQGGPPIHPNPMTTEQAVEHLLEQRERLGISYIQIQQGQIENFLPVLARLNGK
jgi:alkanesulfonate monooxygenase SsuD/methylene tetrahydromethanopterin reductase-like flavin-dependent oxidoreductase (luciferase family)